MHALILAPRGRDAAIARDLLARAGVASRDCRSLQELVPALGDDVACVMVTEEAVRTADLRPLADWIAAQPAWSDLPVILVTDHGGGPERNPIAARWLDALGNVSFIERPFHPTTLLSVARAAIKGRRRQHQARDLLERLRLLADQLERRVAERTSQLQHAHDELLAEIAERERTEDQLRHMQKLESIGQLTGGVAHDFNNLLTAVLGNLELLRKRLPSDPVADRLVDGAVQGAQRGAALTQRLLAFARRQALEPRPVDLTALVRGMDELLRRSVGPRIEIRLDLPDGLPAAHADDNQIELALLNLAVNARDAMPDGGTLTVALDLVEEPTAPDLASGAYLRLAVVDTGTGMDGETLRRAIEPFFSTKEIGKGTGLGLSMIHGLAVQLDGALRLSSRPGEGTRAELLLPVAAGQPVAAGPAAQTTAASGGRATLLFVDDDFLISLSTVALLEDLGHTVIQANSGARALEVLRSDRAVDLLITDYAMPGMTGAQLAEEARRLRPGLPILLATGYADLPSGGVALDLPRLTKPYVQSQLAERIAALID
ncbi:MAG: response regulator [Enhydrobacter sp.]|nr:MAG: response regulator [Enhydrobacter sp.]